MNKTSALRPLGVLVIQGDRGRIIRGPLLGPGLTQRYLVVDDGGASPEYGAVEASEIVEEGLFAMLSCGTAAITALGAAGTAVPTGGAGLLLMVPAAASAAACGMGIGRTINAATGSWKNKQLDSMTGYKVASLVIDGIQVTSAGVSAYKAIKHFRIFGIAKGTKNASILSGKPHASAAVRKNFAKLAGLKTAKGTKATYLTRAEFTAIGNGIRGDLVSAAGDLFGSAASSSGVINKTAKLVYFYVIELDGTDLGD